MSAPPELREALEIRVRGRVQGVGFRPAVHRLASALGLRGEVLNDGSGVLIRASGAPAAMTSFLARIELEPPPLARIDTVESSSYVGELGPSFRIVESAAGSSRTQITPDAVVCAACASEVLEPFARRFRYPFTTCTHCGPRLSLVTGVPYDRPKTSLAGFALCEDCVSEYRDPADRRFHAEAIACHRCGPRARLMRLDGRACTFEATSMLDDVDAARGLLQGGAIVAIKGLGGYHLACDATKRDAVERLRDRKHRDAKPFALMARDLLVVRRFCAVNPEEERALTSSEGPIVLLRADGPEKLPEAVAPRLDTLGFMLPTTPLHVLLLRRVDRPVVMTSGNVSDEPPVTNERDLEARLGGIADYALVHDRGIANRVDDSVVRVIGGEARVLRRARGYAPAPLRLPPGFEQAPALLAYGGELKSTFCLLQDGEAVLSQHQGDLEDARTFDDYRRALELYAELFDHAPRALVVDEHPDYLSSQLGRSRAGREGLPLFGVQHHHAHAAACLAENAWPCDGPPVLAVVLDGLGYGEDGALWGGELLLADYRAARRVGTFKPVAMLGGAQASREPWRNLYAHLMAEMGWPAFSTNFRELALHRALSEKPRALLDGMLRTGVGAPIASSCGRLFDAVAAATGLLFERQTYEGQAGAMLEAAVCEDALANEDEALAYPFDIPNLRGRFGVHVFEGRLATDGGPLPYLEPIGMWNALLGDLVLDTPVGVIAARFHRGLARALGAMVEKLADRAGERRFDTVALSGGCFQNRVLFEQVERRLVAAGFRVLGHARVPANDGGLALGQAAIAAARILHARARDERGCV